MSEILGGGKKVGEAGSHFTDSQTKAGNFRNVSQIWREKCITFDEGLEKLATEQQVIEDFREPLSAFNTVVTDKGQFSLRKKSTGRDYIPTGHALRQLAVSGQTASSLSIAVIRQMPNCSSVSLTIRCSISLGSTRTKPVCSVLGTMAVCGPFCLISMPS